MRWYYWVALGLVIYVVWASNQGAFSSLTGSANRLIGNPDPVRLIGGCPPGTTTYGFGTPCTPVKV